jgi:FtsZ-interacting cell division protein ZipA
MDLTTAILLIVGAIFLIPTVLLAVWAIALHRKAERMSREWKERHVARFDYPDHADMSVDERRDD